MELESSASMPRIIPQAERPECLAAAGRAPTQYSERLHGSRKMGRLDVTTSRRESELGSCFE